MCHLSIDSFQLFIAMITFAGVLIFGILVGVLIGTFLSLIEILYRFSFPHMVVIGRIPGTNMFGDIIRHPDNEAIPGVFIYRIDAPLIFANAESFKENFLKALGREQRPIHLAIIDLDSSPFTDVTAIDMIRELITELERKDIALRLANVTGQARDVLRAAGIEDKVGKLDQTTTIAALLEQNKNSHSG